MMFRLVAVVGGVLAASPTLEDVFGPQKSVETMSAPWKASKERPARSAAFHDRRTATRCDFPIDVLLVQDATASFEDNFNAMVSTQLPTMVSEITKNHPDSRFAAMSFRDKPIVPFGTPETDYCERIGLDFTSNVTLLTDYYASLTRVGGGDPAENQFGALMAAGQSFELSWSLSVDSANLIVLVTDAPPHFEGDGNDVQGMTPNTGLFIDELAEQQCIKQYYPTPDQVMYSVQAAEAYLATIVYDPEYWTGLPGSSWRWFNRFIGQPDSFANIGAQDNTDFWAHLSQIIQNIEHIECGTIVPTKTPTTTEPSAIVTPAGTPQKTATTPVPNTTAPAPSSNIVPTPASTTVPPVDPTVSGECNPEVYCEDGVQLKFVKKPEILDIVIDGKPVEIA